MVQKNTILGVITARGGSKGVPGKNVRELNGKPLISYTIAAASKSTLLNRFVVSTEDEEIASIASEHNAEVLMRPEELATDTATSIDVINHVLSQVDREYEYVMILQPTSPLRTADDIDACIALALQHNADSVFSLKELQDFAVQKIKTMDKDGRIQPLMQEEEYTSAPRSEGKPVYKRNCAIYLTKTNLLKNGDMFGKHSYGYVMPEERSIDINTETDFALASFWLQHGT